MKIRYGKLLVSTELITTPFWPHVAELIKLKIYYTDNLTNGDGVVVPLVKPRQVMVYGVCPHFEEMNYIEDKKAPQYELTVSLPAASIHDITIKRI